MPNIIGAAEKAARLAERPAVAVLRGERCLSVRDMDAPCAMCGEVCPHGAIEVLVGHEAPAAPHGSVVSRGPSGPRFDDERCTRCGRCVTACPTGALLPLAPYDDETLLAIAARVGQAAAETALSRAAGDPAGQAASHAADGEAPSVDSPEPGEIVGPADAGAPSPVAAAGFVCERAARALRVDAERVAALPCLAWLDEALLVQAACSGAQRVFALTAPCASCDQAAAIAGLAETAENAQAILNIWHIPATVELADKGRADAAKLVGLAAEPDEEASGEVSRRGMFSQARDALRDAAENAANAQIGKLAGTEAPAAPDPEPDVRRWRLLDNLHAAGLPQNDAAIVPRALAPRVSIDVEHCAGCGLCAAFCPTGALRKAGKGNGGRTIVEFDPSLCRDCGTCEGTCRYGALIRDESLSASELFALDPHTTLIPKRRVLPTRR